MSTRATDITVWTRARDGAPQSQNEDAVRVDDGRGTGGSSVFVAIADGVGAAPFSGEWARALVDAATPTWLADDLVAGVDAVRRQFDPMAGAGVDFVLEDLWRERGSAATLLIAEVVSDANGTSVRAAAVGDSIVLASDQRSVVSFPVAAAADFTSRPEAVATRPRDLVVQQWAMDVAPGSWVAMASDGIGMWMLGLAESAGPVALFDWLGDVDVDTLPEIDDDLTLVLIRVPERAPTNWWRRLRRFLTGS